MNICIRIFAECSQNYNTKCKENLHNSVKMAEKYTKKPISGGLRWNYAFIIDNDSHYHSNEDMFCFSDNAVARIGGSWCVLALVMVRSNLKTKVIYTI